MEITLTPELDRFVADEIAVEESERGEGVPLTPELIEEIWKEAMAEIEKDGVPSS